MEKYIATTETSKHRLFQIISSGTVPDHMVITIGLQEYHFGILSSRLHEEWALEMGGTLEDRPRYNKTVCFEPFPFPDASFAQRALIEEIARELDGLRRDVLEKNERLTMTKLYNLVEEARTDPDPAPDREATIASARARIVAKLHDDLDAAVAAAYGWEWPLPPAEIVARLIALNAERAAEEKAGTIRWLRPDYQIPRFAKE